MAAKYVFNRFKLQNRSMKLFGRAYSMGTILV